MAVKFIGARKKIGAVDFGRIANAIGITEDPLHAVVDVEAAGSGYDKSGRVKMLFEPHIFFKELKDPKKRALAVSKGLAYAKWGAQKYPKDSYPRLLQAIEIDETAALRSASWGLPQLMGFNHAMAGYKTPQDMVSAFADSESAQVEAMVAFIKGRGLAKYLQKLDFDSFAKGYNGPGYKKNNYGVKLRQRYAHWKAVADTPWKGIPVPAIVEQPVLPLEPLPVPAPTPVEVLPLPEIVSDAPIQPTKLDRIKATIGSWWPTGSRTVKGGIVALGGLAAQAGDLKAQLAPYADIKIVGTIIMVLTFVSVAYMLYARFDDFHKGKNNKDVE